MKFHSQHGQDEWVLQTLGYKKNGFFLDSGAYDPISFSNTYNLEKEFNWKGICIEPLPQYVEKLKKERTCTVIQGLLDDNIGEANFIEYEGLSGIPEYMCTADYIRVSNQSKFKGQELKNFIIKMPTLTISSILEEYNAPKIIDYWSLDTEGSEYRILKSFPWDKYKIFLLTVEHNQGEPHCSNIRKYLSEIGYKVLPNLLCPWEDHFQKL